MRPSYGLIGGRNDDFSARTSGCDLPDAVPPINEAKVRIRIGTGGGESIPAVRIRVTMAPMGIAKVINVAAAVVAAAAVIDTGYRS